VVSTPGRAGIDLHLELAPGPGGTGRALERALREAVRDGRLPAGARLPGSRSLAADLGLARGTVVQAYAQLTAEGWLTTAPGSATRVAPHHTRRPRPSERPRRPRRPRRPGRHATTPAHAWQHALDELTALLRE
jgi:GntR family transcriptional regulator/MocR family aminotransferase